MKYDRDIIVKLFVLNLDFSFRSTKNTQKQ